MSEQSSKDRSKTGTTMFWALLTTVVFESITCISRFGLGLVSTRDTATIGQYTFGLRIHHGYIGLMLFPVALQIRKTFPRISNLLVIVGFALFASDLIHHFVVLWIFTGNPSFDFWYP